MYRLRSQPPLDSLGRQRQNKHRGPCLKMCLPCLFVNSWPSAYCLISLWWAQKQQHANIGRTSSSELVRLTLRRASNFAAISRLNGGGTRKRDNRREPCGFKVRERCHHLLIGCTYIRRCLQQLQHFRQCLLFLLFCLKKGVRPGYMHAYASHTGFIEPIGSLYCSIVLFIWVG